MNPPDDFIVEHAGTDAPVESFEVRHERNAQVGIVVFGHGSSVVSANEAVMRVAAEAAARGSWKLYTTAFLEVEPTLPKAVSALVAKGAERILVLPYFLTLGIHLQRDLPKLVDELAQHYKMPIQITPPLDGHAELSHILVDRATEALAG